MKTVLIVIKLILILLLCVTLSQCSNIKILYPEDIEKKGLTFKFYETKDVEKLELYKNKKNSDTLLGKLYIKRVDGLSEFEGFIINNQFIMDGRYLHYRGANKLVHHYGSYKNNIRNGTFQIFRDDGTLSKLELITNDTTKLMYVSFYDNGKMRSVGNYINHKYKNGLHLMFYENGNISLKKTYNMGNPIGEYIKYHKNGMVAEIGEYSGEYIVYNLKTKNYYTNKGDTIDIKNPDYSNIIKGFFTSGETTFFNPEERLHFKKNSVKYFDENNNLIREIWFKDNGDILEEKEYLPQIMPDEK